MMKPPKVKRPKMPQSPLDNKLPVKTDETATAFKTLISTSPMGVAKAAGGAKKTLLGGVK